MKTFGQILRQKRKEKELAQWELAEEIGVNQRTVSTWEKGQRWPTLFTAMAIADVLGCTLDELVGREAKG